MKVAASWSSQCTSPTICGTEFPAGRWGHGTFVRDTATGVVTGEVEVAFAFHDVQSSAPLHATSHLKTHLTRWSIGAGFDPAFVPHIVFDDYYSTFTGSSNAHAKWRMK
jgi:hypothetical protein